MNLPNKEESRVEDGKISNYLLNLDHQDGGPKAKFFFRFGYSIDRIDEFRSSLLNHAIVRDVSKCTNTGFGTKYELVCEIDTPDRRNPCIVTVWIIEEKDDRPRLITAYPS